MGTGVGDTSSHKRDELVPKGRGMKLWSRSCRWLSRLGGPQVPRKESSEAEGEWGQIWRQICDLKTTLNLTAKNQRALRNGSRRVTRVIATD